MTSFTSPKALAAALSALALTTPAMAGGLDRSGQSIDPIFETGTYAELSFANVTPSVTGTLGGALSSGNMAASYTLLGLGYKQDLGDMLSVALIFDQPYGANVDYGDADTGYPFRTAKATISTNAVTAVMRYKLDGGVSVHGGISAMQSKGEIALPAIGVAPVYTLDTSRETDFGYLIGAAYEKPDIALRAALTYHSGYKVNFDTTESTVGSSTLEVKLPEAVNFDFQTGIAQDTLLSFGARWAKWKDTVIDPTGYAKLLSYDSNRITYELGLARRFSDKLAGNIELGYEAADGNVTGNLGPTDGMRSIGLGMRYSLTDATDLSVGVKRLWLGDATTSSIAAQFNDNTATAIGVKIAHRF